MTAIHPTALIEPGATVHPSARIGPYCIVEAGAVIGADCVLDSHVRIFGATRMGRGNRVCHGASIGSEPQDLSWNPARAYPLIIGDHNHFKECVNISRGAKTAAGTRLGHHNYLMAFSHIGHDCQVGDHNILANTATLGGHVELASHSFISGQVAVHQFCRVGDHVMIGGVSGVSRDVPPFVIANGQRAHIVGLNLVGLRRRGFDQLRRSRIAAVYRLLFRGGLRLCEALDQALLSYPGDDTEAIVAFVRASTRGVMGFTRRPGRGPSPRPDPAGEA
ncbi:MAG: acyl-[acyl-carrier-protein]--UDP-N-acetylglucosamine O-acyltransferase [Chromatiaceae bacterium]|nr:MAG: acyl-[acyl-carrier-protein]--UDP-N-acetylglucosamine O-acyltransferase [Chromatiaceae bacterium]